ncbi:heterokaryon incompatibility protein-domain-containing protein [Biscogniauxia sp. FL1348]|nr:heterokaryon incompatibility protein-domain-containing protein [Biscogniauxia sp. FL1348]
MSFLAEEHVLCSACHSSASNSSLLPKLAKGKELFRSYETFAELQESSAAGCHLCSLFLGEFGYGDPNSLRQGRRVEVQLTVSRTGGAWLKVVSIPRVACDATSPHNEVKEQVMGELSVFRKLDGRIEEPRPDSPFVFSDPSIYRNAQLSKSLSYDYSAALGREWLKQCIDRHQSCSAASKIISPTHGYPTRLIDVGAAGSQGVLKLVLTSEAEKSQPNSKPLYLTLSHCWGGAEILKLLEGNIEKLRNAIDFAELPRTFQDAIVITRQLGFQYLWIDSLCIMQDCPADWKSESAIMGEIYAHSTCTIAALTSRSSFEGCFMGHGDQHSQGATNVRNPLAFRICNLPHGLHAEYSQRLELELRINRRPLPLHTRAWVLQERLLAPRTLYYGAWGLAWECVECSATEGNPFGGASQFVPKASFLTTCLQAIQKSSQDKIDTAYNMWLTVQAAYTVCQLTFFDDRIVAISSVIKQIGELTSWTNVWGLWKEKILHELLWFVESPGERPSTKSYLAPSWSWMGIRGPIFTDTFAEGLSALWTAEVIEVGTAHEEGLIRLRAAAKDVFSPQGRTSDLVDKGSQKRKAVSWSADTHEPLDTRELTCLLIMRVKNAYERGFSYDVGLVVTRVRGKLIRVGRFWQARTDSFPLFDAEIQEEDMREVVIL